MVRQHSPCLRCVLVVGPHARHWQEWMALSPMAQVVCARAAQALEVTETDLLVLADSARPYADLQWMRQQGWDARIAQHAAAGGRVWGAGAGLLMLGEALIDTHNIAGNVPGLGVLPMVSVRGSEHLGQPTVNHWPCLGGAWRALAQQPVRMTPIDSGRCAERADMQTSGQPMAQCWHHGQVWQSAVGGVAGALWLGVAQAVWRAVA